ncbi:MAG: type IA DNA topoisomerase, partial [Candidatus Izemoplasmatales bacterium]
QETRRMLDRIIGFKLSTLLKSKIKSQSAGRVQSAALKLIVDLEKEINKFVPEEYYEISAQFGEVEAELFKVNNEKPVIPNEEIADNILNSLNDSFKVIELSKKESKSYSRPALTTSSLQQAASSKYNYSADKTMTIAQMLYEGIEYQGEMVGLITYMRTDSTRLSDSFVNDTKKYIKDSFGPKYLGYYRPLKNKDNAQDAHEAIRPTSVYRTPEDFKKYLDSKEFEKFTKTQNNKKFKSVSSSQLYKIYKLIYDKAVGSLMSPAINEVTTLLLENNQTIFKANSSKPIFDGYLKLNKDYEEEKEKQTCKIENFQVNETIKADKVNKKQFFTSPPARYTEAKLIKAMEELGIGRPSTYASTVSTLLKRKYVTLKERKFFPTEQGTLTTEKLDQFFHEFISTSYSKKMEETLDEIAEGNELQNTVLQDFYDYFMPLIDKAKA